MIFKDISQIFPNCMLINEQKVDLAKFGKCKKYDFFEKKFKVLISSF